MFFRYFKLPLIRSTGIYTLSNVLNQSIPFLLIPILTRYLSPFDYGLVATFQVLVGFITPFLGLNVHGAIARKYYEKNVDMPRYVANCLFIMLISLILVSLAVYILTEPISRLATFSPGWLWAVVPVSASQFLNQVRLTLWQVQKKPIPYGAFQVLQTIFHGMISIYFILGLGMKWQGWVLAYVIASSVFGSVALISLWIQGWIKPGINYEYCVSALKFGIPLVPHAFSGWILTAIDRILINRIVGVAHTGIYSVAYQVVMVLTLFQNSFNMAWVPWFYEKLEQDDDAIKYKIIKFTYLYVLLMILFAFLLIWLAPVGLSIFVGKDFRGAGKFINWLALAKAVQAMYFMTCNYIFYVTKTAYVALASFLSACVHIITTYSLLNLYGTIGAAQATFVSTLVLVIFTWIFASRVYKMPWSLRLIRKVR